MYEVLADAYNLTQKEREALDCIGRHAEEDFSGTDSWVGTTLGKEFLFDEWESLAYKTASEGDPQKLTDLGAWYSRGTPPIFDPNLPRHIVCVEPPGCGRTMAAGMFPFYGCKERPIESRCTDCIRSTVRTPTTELQKQRIRGQQLREILKANGSQSMAVPHVSEVIGGLVVEMGGTDAIVREWKRLLIHGQIKDEAKLKRFEQLAKFIATCNEIERESQDALDRTDPEQVGRFIVGLLQKYATKTQADLILNTLSGVPQHEVALIEDGQA